MRILVTGVCGFIGGAMWRLLAARPDVEIIAVDICTYSAVFDPPKTSTPRNQFYQVNLTDETALNEIFKKHKPQAVLNLAAETHVDRSIDNPKPFVMSNVVGTQTLLEVARQFWNGLEDDEKAAFRFVQISTDEVYGTLGAEGQFFETTPFAPNSPYSSSKAGADLMVRAYHQTWGFPAIVTHGCNTYGPWQFPEKLVPTMILKALHGEALPVYGDGMQRREWLHADDHARGILAALERGVLGERYNIGSEDEHPNIEIVERVCTILDELAPRPNGKPYIELKSTVKDRPGHDRRYALNTQKARSELGWKPQVNFEAGMRETVEWYLNNQSWWENIRASGFKGQRLGISS